MFLQVPHAIRRMRHHHQGMGSIFQQQGRQLAAKTHDCTELYTASLSASSSLRRMAMKPPITPLCIQR